jgi:hypothetical protein
MRHYTVEVTLEIVLVLHTLLFKIPVKITTFNNRLEHKCIVPTRGLGPSEKLMEQDSLKRLTVMVQPPIARG